MLTNHSLSYPSIVRNVCIDFLHNCIIFCRLIPVLIILRIIKWDLLVDSVKRHFCPPVPIQAGESNHHDSQGEKRLCLPTPNPLDQRSASLVFTDRGVICFDSGLPFALLRGVISHPFDRCFPPRKFPWTLSIRLSNLSLYVMALSPLQEEASEAY